MSQLKRLKAGRPTVPCVVFVPRPDADIVTAAIRAGASGVMMADDNRELIVNALRLVLAGGVYLSPAPVDALVGGEKPWGPLPGEQITANAVHDLTSRQRQVLDLVRLRPRQQGDRGYARHQDRDRQAARQRDLPRVARAQPDPSGAARPPIPPLGPFLVAARAQWPITLPECRDTFSGADGGDGTGAPIPS